MKRSNDKQGKLNLKKETLRKLQLLTLRDDHLRQVAGGAWCSANCPEGISIQARC